MSGFEVAGIVLGGFPLLITGLEHYRKGFEPLEEWWQFRTAFIEFVDDIQHQLMRYTRSLTRLLDPIIGDTSELHKLISDTSSLQWTDQGLSTALDARLGSERPRWIRILSRMEEVLVDLKKLLKIEAGGWVNIDSPGRIYHLTRLQVAFSRGKHKKTKRLAKLNSELEDILTYSDTIIPVAEARTVTGPLSVIDAIRKHLCAVHFVLKCNWRCQCCTADCHQIHVSLKLWSEPRVENEADLVVLTDFQQSLNKIYISKLCVASNTSQRSKSSMPNLSHVGRSMEFTKMQMSFEQRTTQKVQLKTSRLRTMLSSKGTPLQAASQNALPERTEMQSAILSRTAQASHAAPQSTINGSKVENLCSAVTEASILGHLLDDYDRAFDITGSLISSMPCSQPAMRSLADILGAAEGGHLNLSRHRRFDIAARVASAVLQMQVSPWLRAQWSASDVYLLTDNKPVSQTAFIKQTFSSVHVPHSPTQSTNWEDWTEDDTRHSLFNLGVVILELVFARPLTTCPFWSVYMGADGRPNDQTNANAARKWSQSVLPECGVEIADVVRRCLDCSFGPRPDIKERRFREAVYKGVVEPLQNYMTTWKAIGP